MISYLESLDHALFYLINREGQNSFFDVIMPILSNIKVFYIPIAVIWLYLFTRKRIKYRAVALGVLVLICVSEWISSDVLKPAFERRRPYHRLADVHKFGKETRQWQITPEPKSDMVGASQSLPSSHATNIFAVAYFMSFFLRRWWPLFYAIALAVGYSRVYVGFHFPFDVLAGAGVGSLCAVIMAQLTHYTIRVVRVRFSKTEPVVPKS